MPTTLPRRDHYRVPVKARFDDLVAHDRRGHRTRGPSCIGSHFLHHLLWQWSQRRTRAFRRELHLRDYCIPHR